MKGDRGFLCTGVSFGDSRVVRRKVLPTYSIGFSGRLFLSEGLICGEFWCEMTECAWNYFRDKGGMVKIEQN